MSRQAVGLRPAGFTHAEYMCRACTTELPTPPAGCPHQAMHSQQAPSKHNCLLPDTATPCLLQATPTRRCAASRHPPVQVTCWRSPRPAAWARPAAARWAALPTAAPSPALCSSTSLWAAGLRLGRDGATQPLLWGTACGFTAAWAPACSATFTCTRQVRASCQQLWLRAVRTPSFASIAVFNWPLLSPSVQLAVPLSQHHVLYSSCMFCNVSRYLHTQQICPSRSWLPSWSFTQYSHPRMGSHPGSLQAAAPGAAPLVRRSIKRTSQGRCLGMQPALQAPACSCLGGARGASSCAHCTS